MTQYVKEAVAISLKGSITCGSRCGYEGNKGLTLEETINILERVNREIADAGSQSIPCIVREGVLVGRTDTQNYREIVYTMEFSWSPRAKPMKRDTFYEKLLEYADKLGQAMEQERIYVEFDGKTEVLKKRNKHPPHITS